MDILVVFIHLHKLKSQDADDCHTFASSGYPAAGGGGPCSHQAPRMTFLIRVVVLVAVLVARSRKG